LNISIHSDAIQEGRWFQNLSRHFHDAELKIIGPRGTNSHIIEEIIKYDRPDIILIVDNEVKLVLEKTEEVPTGHNMGQRFARIVRSAELHLPFIFFAPFVAMKHGTYANQCYINARVFYAIKKLSEIHQTPIMLVNWICDDEYELIRDGREDEELAILIDDIISNDFDFEKSTLTQQVFTKMDDEYKARIKMHPNYQNPPKSVLIRKTDDFKTEYLSDFDISKIPKYFFSRDKTLLYKIGMTPQNCRREDPYTGMQLVYDYHWCRYGENTMDRSTNLVLWIPYVDVQTWKTKNPNEINKKRHLYYSIPDLLVLKDGLIVPKKFKQETLI